MGTGLIHFDLNTTVEKLSLIAFLEIFVIELIVKYFYKSALQFSLICSRRGFLSALCFVLFLKILRLYLVFGLMIR